MQVSLSPKYDGQKMVLLEDRATLFVWPGWQQKTKGGTPV